MRYIKSRGASGPGIVTRRRTVVVTWANFIIGVIAIGYAFYLVGEGDTTWAVIDGVVGAINLGIVRWTD